MTNDLQQTALLAIAQSDTPCKPKWWIARNPTKSRIYLYASSKHAVAYIAFDDATTLEGPHIGVTLRNCGQSRRWYAKQAQQIANWAFPAYIEIVRLNNPMTADQLQREYNDTDERYRCKDVPFNITK